MDSSARSNGDGSGEVRSEVKSHTGCRVYSWSADSAWKANTWHSETHNDCVEHVRHDLLHAVLVFSNCDSSSVVQLHLHHAHTSWPGAPVLMEDAVAQMHAELTAQGQRGRDSAIYDRHLVPADETLLHQAHYPGRSGQTS